VFALPFKSKSRLEAENAALRHQLSVLRRKVRGRVQLTNSDRWFLIQLYRWFPSVLKVITIVRPETLVQPPKPMTSEQDIRGEHAPPYSKKERHPGIADPGG
jgi:hypothetical protein